MRHPRTPTTPSALSEASTASRPLPEAISAPKPKAAWGIQVGSFRDPGTAEQLVARLRTEGIAAEDPKSVTIDGNTFHRVRAGQLADRQQAIALLPRLKAIIGTEGIVVWHR